MSDENTETTNVEVTVEQQEESSPDVTLEEHPSWYTELMSEIGSAKELAASAMERANLAHSLASHTESEMEETVDEAVEEAIEEATEEAEEAAAVAVAAASVAVEESNEDSGGPPGQDMGEGIPADTEAPSGDIPEREWQEPETPPRQDHWLYRVFGPRK